MVKIFLGKWNWQRGGREEHGAVFAEGETEDGEESYVDDCAPAEEGFFRRWWGW